MKKCELNSGQSKMRVVALSANRMWTCTDMCIWFHETLRRDISLQRVVTLGCKGRNGEVTLA